MMVLVPELVQHPVADSGLAGASRPNQTDHKHRVGMLDPGASPGGHPSDSRLEQDRGRKLRGLSEPLPVRRRQLELPNPVGESPGGVSVRCY